MSVASLWPDVVDQLVARMRATTGYRAPTSSENAIPVYDGPEYMDGSAHDREWIAIGWDGDADAPEQPGQTSMSWPVLATTHPKDDLGVVQCLIGVDWGEVDVKGSRDAAFTILAALDGVVRAAPNLGIAGATGQLRSALVADASVEQWLSAGSKVRLHVTVTYRART